MTLLLYAAFGLACLACAGCVVLWSDIRILQGVVLKLLESPRLTVVTKIQGDAEDSSSEGLDLYAQEKTKRLFS